LLSQTDRHGAIAACGLAGGAQLNTTVFPFILRGVQLLGIDSNTCPETQRTRAWKRLAETAPPDLLDQIAEIVPLRDVPEQCETLLAGKIRGRLVVDVKA
jgi:acrylyl-CoA reductase (NADPH)